MHLETLHANPNSKDTTVTQHTCGIDYIDPVACLTMVHICEALLACRQLANKKSNASLLIQRGEKEDRIWVRCYLPLWWPFCHYVYRWSISLLQLAAVFCNMIGSMPWYANSVTAFKGQHLCATKGFVPHLVALTGPNPVHKC